MSHFTVLVVGENVEEQLNPFYETSDYDDEENRPFLEFKDDVAYGYKDEYAENKVLEYGEDKGKTLQEAYPSYEAFLKDWAGLDTIDPVTGKYGNWYNPNAKWDWYEIGGRWTGFFKMKNKNDGKAGRPGLMTEPAKLGFADQAQISQIDFEGMREKAGKEAQERYERAERLLGSIPKIQYRWKDLIDEKGTHASASIEEKRSLYHGQPAMRIVNLAKESLTEGVKEDRDFLTWIDLEDYQITKEQYIKKAKDGAISTFAVIKDGKWFERGQMGWWACVSNEKEDSTWEAEFSKLIEGLPPETLLTIVDCHI